VEEAAAGVDAIVHLAAHTRVIDSINQPLHDMEVNIQGTLNLLEAARKHGVKRFIFASSGAALGEQSPPIDEERVPRPAAPYGAAKLAGEGYCSAFYRSFGLETVALRFSNVYGPRSFHKGSVIAHFIKQLLHGNPLEIYGDGTQTRDFLFIHDLTDAICASLSPASNGIAGEVFQIASGRETTVLEIAQMIQDHAGRVGLRSEVIFKPSRKGEVYRNYATIEKAGRLLHYAPKTSLTEGLAATWDWFWTSWQGSRP
jgi:UDP-glucose 4-epimerase